MPTKPEMTTEERIQIGDALCVENIMDTQGKWMDAFTQDSKVLSLLQEAAAMGINKHFEEGGLDHIQMMVHIANTFMALVIFEIGPSEEEIQAEFDRRWEMRGTDD